MVKAPPWQAWRQAALAAALAAIALACPTGSAAQEKLPVVATFDVLADVVGHVGGDAVQVESLVEPGGDVHVFQPGSNHARRLAGARLVVSNGLGFEGWIERLVRSSGYRGRVVVATDGLVPLASRAAERGDREEVERAHAGHLHAVDPHAWQSVPNLKRYVANIADALCEVAPASCEGFRDNAARYALRLDDLDREIRGSFAGIAPERRKVITSHRAFGYYAREYGVQFLAPVGVSTDVEPSAAAVGRLIRQVRQERVNAFFVEGFSDARLIERIRAETGGARPGRLYADGLSGPDGPAATYEAMMRYNTRTIMAALSEPAAVPPGRP
jgi:zinc/manganese transport system substrate-binding protein